MDAFTSAARTWGESLRTTWRLLRRNRAGFVGLWVVIGFVLLAYVGPHVLPINTQVDVAAIDQPPSWHHLLGTDTQGRDIFSQIVLGGAGVISVAVLASAISTFIAISLGALAAFLGGAVDAFLLGVADVVLTIPQFPLLAVLAGLVRFQNLNDLAVILGLLSWPTLLRAVRAQVLSLREMDYVQAARALDLGTAHIIFREILPNLFSYIAVNFIFGMTSAIYSEVGLIFLGLVPLATNNWGVMISLAWVQGAIFYGNSLSYILSPVIAIALFQLALVSLSRGLDEVFNPRLRTDG